MGAGQLVLTAHRSGRTYPSGDDRWIFATRGDSGPATRRMGTTRAGKPGHRGDHRLCRIAASLEPVTVPEPQPSRSPSASACEPYGDVIELGLSRGRNAMAI
jgi:hypothetical protein